MALQTTTNLMQSYGTDLEKKATARDQMSGMLSQQQKDVAVGATVANIGGIAGSVINYDMLKVENMFKENQADQIEVQAQEQANMLRENFNVMLGQEAVTTARRGIKQSSGSVRASKELSSKNVGEDIQSIKSSAKNKVKQIRTQASIDKRLGRAKRNTELASGLSSLGTNLGTMKSLGIT